MIAHVVLFSFKPEISEDKISQLMAGLDTLKEKFPTVIDMKSGENFSERSKGLTHGLVMFFQSRKALEDYMVDPRHREMADPVIEAAADVLAFDFEAP